MAVLESAAQSDIPPVEPRRYKLVPDDTQSDPGTPSPIRRRYSLARVAPSSRSALGVDRLERMEEIAELDRGDGSAALGSGDELVG
jgi:hypothetical protein